MFFSYWAIFKTSKLALCRMLRNIGNKNYLPEYLSLEEDSL